MDKAADALEISEPFFEILLYDYHDRVDNRIKIKHLKRKTTGFTRTKTDSRLLLENKIPIELIYYPEKDLQAEKNLLTVTLPDGHTLDFDLETLVGFLEAEEKNEFPYWCTLDQVSTKQEALLKKACKPVIKEKNIGSIETKFMRSELVEPETRDRKSGSAEKAVLVRDIYALVLNNKKKSNLTYVLELNIPAPERTNLTISPEHKQTVFLCTKPQKAVYKKSWAEKVDEDRMPHLYFKVKQTDSPTMPIRVLHAQIDMEGNKYLPLINKKEGIYRNYTVIEDEVLFKTDFLEIIYRPIDRTQANLSINLKDILEFYHKCIRKYCPKRVKQTEEEETELLSVPDFLNAVPKSLNKQNTSRHKLDT